jgi:hypothetical protein
MKLLVFPSDCESDLRLFRSLERMGIEVVGASSTHEQYFLGKQSLFLPYITDSLFEEELTELIKQHSISHLYTSHSGVWGMFSVNHQALSEKFPITVCSDFPFDNVYTQFESSLSWGAAVYDRLSQEGVIPAFNAEQMSSLCENYNRIPGQSDNDKLEALLALAPSVPKGDWVEIGSLYGRSSYALSMLSKGYHGDNLVCIDPWDLGKLVPQQGKASMLDEHAKLVDLGKVFEIFKCTISLLDNATYIRDRSENALPRYLNSKLDGNKLVLEHRISFLHIDGNHHFDEVSTDIALWEPHVCIGGWVAIDDYLWAFGDGPRRAGDILLNTGRFDTAFVQGDTLYMQKSQID